LRPNHLDNFGTNLTSTTNASDTTSPVNSVPSIAAPFWVAFDATNINSHYERKLITSKTATNILHSALSYDHTTDEEVRIVNPAEEFDAIYQPPRGYLINGKISVLDSAGITVAIKTLADADPSESDPVFVRIGDSVQTVITPLSVSKADGTNWFNAGSAELATKEIDYFVYLGYNATDGVTIGFSRIPGANQYSDFSVTTTNEKYCAISTITTAASTDYYENIGRFAATLSAGAGYTWTVPTFTASNLIQRPIYETRKLSWVPTITGYSSAPTGGNYMYQLVGKNAFAWIQEANNGTSNATTLTETMPISPDYTQINFPPSSIFVAQNNSAATTSVVMGLFLATNVLTMYLGGTPTGWTAAGTKRLISGNIVYPI
jgi:hypothetical protein